jgi:hypothetical protein
MTPDQLTFKPNDLVSHKCMASTQPLTELKTLPSGLFIKSTTVVNDVSSVISMLQTVASLIDEAGVVIYDRNMFLILATDFNQLAEAGNTKGGSTTVQLTSSLMCLESAV